MCSPSSNLRRSNCTFVQLPFTAMRCYAPANSSPLDLLARFWGEEGERKGGKGKDEGKRKGKEREKEGRNEKWTRGK